MRANTVKPKRKRKHVQNSDGSIEPRKRGRPKTGEKLIKTIQYCQYIEARGIGSSSRHRLCGDLTKVMLHENHMERTGKDHQCVVCGRICTTRCNWCPGKPYMHYKVFRGPDVNSQCFLQYHSRSHYGLAPADTKIFGDSKSSWKEPTDSQIRANTKNMNEHERTYSELHDN